LPKQPARASIDREVLTLGVGARLLAMKTLHDAGKL
jgi:hypothetical protein